MVNLFVGCSHTNGYFDNDGSHPDCKTARMNNKTVYSWGNNNYAELYAKEQNEKTIIYSMSGATNCKYPDWIAYCLQHHNIDKVFVQSTYWTRFRVGAMLDLNIEREIPLDHFTMDPEEDELISRYTDFKYTDLAIDATRQPRSDDWNHFNGHDSKIDIHTYIDEHMTKNYSYTKLWLETISHLQHRNYVKDLMIIDNLCRQHNIPWYLFNMNRNAYIPPNLEMYGPLTNCTRATIPVEGFIKQVCGVDMQDHYIDSEHLDSTYHKLIAKHYIPYLQKIT